MAENIEWADEDFGRGSRQPSPFHVADFVKVMRERRRWMLLSSLVIAIFALVAALFMRNTYASTAVILTPRQDQSLSALISGSSAALSSIGGGGLSGLSLGNRSPNDMYVSLLRSRTLTTQLVQRYNLHAYYKQKTTTGAINALLKNTVIEIGKDNLIRITVSSHDAAFSSQMANAFVDALHDMNTVLALTDSAQRRMFFEGQLKQEVEKMADAEADLAKTQKQTGLLIPSGQAELQARTIASLQAQITSREAALQALGTYAASGNPQYVSLRAEIDSLKRRLAVLENGKADTPGDTQVSASQLPESSLEYFRKYREVQLHEQIYATLQKQLEAARLDEAKEAPGIQVVDRAVPAEYKSGPRRGLLVIGAFAVALILNLLYSCALYVWKALSSQRAMSAAVAQ